MKPLLRPRTSHRQAGADHQRGHQHERRVRGTRAAAHRGACAGLGAAVRGSARHPTRMPLNPTSLPSDVWGGSELDGRLCTESRVRMSPSPTYTQIPLAFQAATETSSILPREPASAHLGTSYRPSLGLPQGRPAAWHSSCRRVGVRNKDLEGVSERRAAFRPWACPGRRCGEVAPAAQLQPSCRCCRRSLILHPPHAAAAPQGPPDQRAGVDAEHAVARRGRAALEWRRPPACRTPQSR